MAKVKSTSSVSPELAKLRAQLKETTSSSLAKVAEAIETTRIKAQIAQLNDTKLIRAKASLAIRTDNLNKLTSLNATCTEIVASMPITSAKTRESRKWSPSAIYGYGPEIGRLVSILTGIQYSATAHKEQMLALTGLPEALIEATLDAYGSEPYYNRNYMTVVEGRPMELARFIENINLVAEVLDITIDTSKLTQAVVDVRYTSALLRAEKQATEDAQTLAMPSLKLD